MTTLDAYIEYDGASLDDLPSEDLHTVEGMRRRKEAIEARRPKTLGRDMLRLDRQAFVDEYRRRYGITPSAREWLAWYDFDKRRLEEARRCGSSVKSRGERR
jgi:hypothetical protein